MRISARGAMKVSSKAKKLQNFGKKWDVGDKGIVLYPVYWDDETERLELLVAQVWGYKVNDMQALGIKTSFIPSNAPIGDDDMPVGQDITAQFSRLAPAFIAGEKAAKMQQIEAKNWPTAAAQKAAMEKLEADYDTKNNMKARKPVVGKLMLLITTECIYIPMKNDVPDWDNAQLVAQTLSSTKISKLLALIDDPQYAMTKDSRYLEVQYNFTAADGLKSTAGKNDPTGITEAFALRNRFPDSVSKLEDLITQLPTDSDIIANHNYSYAKQDEASLKSLFQAYSIMNCESLDTVPEDYETSVVKSAEVIDKLQILSSLTNVALKEKISAELAESANAPTPAPVPTEVPVSTGAPTAAELLNKPALADDEFSDTLNDVAL